MKETILMTVFDRDPDMLMNTFRWLRMSDLSDSEIVVIDDDSDIDYSFMQQIHKDLDLKWIKLDPYACCQIDGKFNNPAKAFNEGLKVAKGENICILSSDVLVPPRTLTAARKHDTSKAIWCPMVVDLATTSEYCGPHRIFPMPWMLYAKTEHVRKCGGWDENYLMGMCWEDNDFVGRLALEVGCIICEWEYQVWHQSHPQPAYEISNQWVKIANDRNRVYTMDKWTGHPFGDPDLVAFGMTRGRDEEGRFALTFEDIKEVKEKITKETLSPFVKQEEEVA